MGFRVVDKSSFTFSFETDIPLSLRHIHPSGVLHAFQPPPPAKASAGSGPGAAVRRAEHTFAWVANCLHIEAALQHLETRGFDRRRGIVFLPYSTRERWLDRYPHAEFAAERADGGVPRPRPAAADGAEDPRAEGRICGRESHHVARRKRKDRYRSRAAHNMFQDAARLPDSERDELHVEIYRYLSWIRVKVVELERKAALVAPDAKEESTISEEVEEVEEEEVDPGGKKPAGTGAVGQPKNNYNRYGMDVSELQGVLDKLEATFPILPNVKLEAAAAAAAAEEEEEQEEEQEEERERPPGADAGEAPPPPPAPPPPVPLLETTLAATLRRAVEARESAGGPRRRSRRRPRPARDRPRRRAPLADFEGMFRRLVRYREDHGDCRVPRSRGAQDPEARRLASWVNGLRNQKTLLVRQGLAHEEILPGQKTLTKSLTAERLARLNALGFVWSVMAPKVAWEERFRDCIEYREAHGQWPSQSMGQLGEWVHKQRTLYSKKDVNYMTHKAPQLDEVGFEWTPRGNTKMTWDAGLELLLEYGNAHGHYDVPCPAPEEGGVKTPGFRLYRWVESLHSMYRSYKLGRQAGSLTDERVVLLIKHGFAFRND